MVSGEVFQRMMVMAENNATIFLTLKYKHS